MAIKKVKLPDNSTQDIHDARISGVDTTVTSGSSNVVTSGAVASAVASSVNGYIPYDDVLMPTNPFGGKKLYINSIDNALRAAHKEFWVQITTHQKTINGVTYPYADPNKTAADDDYWVDSPVVDEISYAASNIFDGSYESNFPCPVGKYVKIHIQFAPFTNDWAPSTTTGTFDGYPYGTYYISYYYVYTPGTQSQLRVYNTFSAHVVGWHLYEASIYNGSLSGDYIEQIIDQGDYSRTCLEFIIFGRDSGDSTLITQLDYKLSRPNLSNNGSTVTKYGEQHLFFPFVWYKHNDSTAHTAMVTISPDSGSVTASSFVKTGGTSSQFLKADGSVDSTSYQAALVSGTNIKTINNESLLGSGNITIQGGGSSDAVLYTSQSLTSAQKLQARTNISTVGYTVDGAGTSTDLGLERMSNKVTSLSASSTDVQYPSAKCVYDIVGNIETLLAAI